MLHALHQLVKALRGIVAKHRTELLHEAIKVRLPALHLVPHHLVELLEHLPHRRHLLGGHSLNLVAHLLRQVLGHLALQHVQQFLELLLGLGVDEVVLHQLFDLASHAFGQLVQLFPVALGPLLQQLVQAFLLGTLVLAGVLHLLLGFFQAPLDALSFCPNDVFQAFLEVVHHRVHIVLLQLLAPPVLQLLQQVLHTR